MIKFWKEIFVQTIDEDLGENVVWVLRLLSPASLVNVG